MLETISPHDAMHRRKRGHTLQREGNSRGLPDARCAVLSTFNMDFFPPLLTFSLEQVGLHADVHLGGFGQIAQAVMNPTSGLYAAEPRNVILVPAVEDLLAPFFDRPAAFSEEAADELVEEQIGELRRSIETLLERLPDVTCYPVVFGSERAPGDQILDPGARLRGQRIVSRMLEEIRGLAALSPRVVVVDWDWYTRASGTEAYRDERLWYLGRMRLNPVGLAALGDLVARHVAAHRGMTSKVAVLDLDNTLWGGVVGEAGLQGIDLGEDGVGRAFQDFQRELLKLHDSGILLAVASKNNPADALEVFDRHSGMILKREHLAAIRINWQDKATNLRELAQELNLGIDSFVFLDDNPVEREWIKQGAPEVAVPELPEDPVQRPGFLRRLPHFQRIAVTEADVQRAESYTAQRHRRELESGASSFEDFLASLEQVLSVEAVHAGSIGRAAQMCQRTNQFNLTTARYTTADIERMMRDPGMELYTLAVKDRFGDSGITGLGILRTEGETTEIDTFLLSCRVLGRKVEDAFLAVLADRAREAGARFLVGRYLPTAKNVQAASFYPDRGFESIAEGRFRLELGNASLSVPSFLTVEVAVHA